MTCKYSDQILSYLDGELSRTEWNEVSQHLYTCPACQVLLDEQKRLQQWSDQAISGSLELSGSVDHLAIDVEAAWLKFSSTIAMRKANSAEADQKILKQPQRRWMQMSKSYKKWIAGAASAIVLGSSLMIPQVQAAANDFLSIFRVQKIEMVKLTNQDLQDIQNWLRSDGVGQKTLNGLGTITVSGNHANTQHFHSAADAKAHGYQAAVAPAGYSTDSITVLPSFTIQLKLDTEKANALLKQLGSNVAFDHSLDDKPFSFSVPEEIVTGFQSQNSHIQYTVLDTPKINVPADVNIDQLRSTLLQLPFIPDDVRSQLAGIQDWKTTLPFPYVEGKNITEKVTVNNVPGVFVEDQVEDQKERIAFLMWQKSDRIHRLEMYADTQAQTTDLKSQLLDIAKLYQ